MYLKMFGMAFVFMVFMVYFFILSFSSFVFRIKEWKIKRGKDNEILKSLKLKILKYQEERMQKWYVLIAIIFCGLIWMPSFTTLWQVNDLVNIPKVDEDTVNVNPVIKPTISEKYGIPEPYYLNTEKRKRNLSELRETLNGIVMPHKYEKGVWDCSESSAYVERVLENNGFDTVICANASFSYNRISKEWEGHAWVVSRGVWNNNKQYRVAVECVSHPHIVTSESYHYPSVEYGDIYTALKKGNPYEWDWWCEI